MNRRMKHISLLSTAVLCAALSACGGGGGSKGAGTASAKPYSTPAFRLFNADDTDGIDISSPFKSIIGTRLNGQLWATDGTTAGTQEIGQTFRITRPIFFNQPGRHAYLDNGKKVVFGAEFSNGYIRAMATDGTVSGTTVLSHTASSLTDRTVFVEVKNKVYFVAGTKIYETDGTLGGTNVVAQNGDTHTSSSGSTTHIIDIPDYFDMKASRDHLYLQMKLQGSNPVQWATFKFLPEKSGSARFEKMNSTSDLNISKMYTVNGHTYAIGRVVTGSSAPDKLWKVSDTGFTNVLSNVQEADHFIANTPNSYADANRFISDDPYNVIAITDRTGGAPVTKLMHLKSDGTRHTITPELPGNALGRLNTITGMFANDKGVYISAGSVQGNQPHNLLYEWGSNGQLKRVPKRLSAGATAGTIDGLMGGTPIPGVSAIKNVGNTALFSAQNDPNNTSTCQGKQLWGTTGTLSIDNIKSVNARSNSPAACGALNANIRFLGTVKNNSLMIFQAKSGTNGDKGQELWVTDGTTANTTMLKNIGPDSTSATTNGVTIDF